MSRPAVGWCMSSNTPTPLTAPTLGARSRQPSTTWTCAATDSSEREKPVDRCAQPLCDRPVRAKGWCILHYRRLQRGTRMDKPVGANIRDGECKTPDGKYIRVVVDGKKQLKHRVVMSQQLGRPLLPTEHVHHRDGNGLNNDPSNLEILSPSEHSSLHNAVKKRDCTICGKRAYAWGLCKRHYQISRHG